MTFEIRISEICQKSEAEIVILPGPFWVGWVAPVDFIGSKTAGNEEISMSRCVQILNFLSNSKYAKKLSTFEKFDFGTFFC